jgi:hypothetical protein
MWTCLNFHGRPPYRDQAVSRWLPIVAARVRARIKSCGILWWGRFPPSKSVSPVIHSFHQLLHNHYHHHLSSRAGTTSVQVVSREIHLCKFPASGVLSWFTDTIQSRLKELLFPTLSDKYGGRQNGRRDQVIILRGEGCTGSALLNFFAENWQLGQSEIRIRTATAASSRLDVAAIGCIYSVVSCKVERGSTFLLAGNSTQIHVKKADFCSRQTAPYKNNAVFWDVASCGSC